MLQRITRKREDGWKLDDSDLLLYRHQGCPGGSPLAIFFREHSQHPDVNLADLTAGTLTFETSMIGGQRKISIDGHQLEIVWVRSDSRRRMRSALRGNHLPLGLDLAFRRYLEKLTRPILIAEFDALLIVLVILTGAFLPGSWPTARDELARRIATENTRAAK